MIRELLASRVAKPVVLLLCLLPAAWLAAAGWRGALGVNPIEKITHETGQWTLRLLLATLAVTPLRRMAGWPELIRFRRVLGLAAFFYATLHLFTYLWLDQFFDWGAIARDIAKRRFITAGMLSFALLVPLALTSTRGWIARLGGRRWQRLHRLIYPAAAAGVVHFWWLVKSDIREPALYGAVLAALLAARLVWRKTQTPAGAAAPARPSAE
ncbi:MAG: protein-methionine-sulfoxide reductase heme-binding subunit MsrQ [Bryobacteraceae bacterium]